MGAESSFLKSCELGEPLDVSAQDWSIHPARRSDGSKVTVFVNKNKAKEDEEHIKNATRQLKILRHPTILKFFDCCKSLEGTFLITEQVHPLELALETLSPEEICSGLYNIVEALAFLHDKGGVSHNNVCIAAIYVSSQDGGWRLGGMEHLCKFEDATLSFLKQCRDQRCKKSIPPEEDEEDNKTTLAPDVGHARDAYSFGVLVQELLEHIGNLGEMTDAFNDKIEREFLNFDPMLRPRLSTLLNDSFFKNDFLEITRFLHNITIKTEFEKNAFFENLAARLYNLPQHLVATKITPLLLTSFALAEPMAVSMLLPHVLTPVKDSDRRTCEFDPHIINPILAEDLFKEHIIPILLQMFPSREIHVRHALLQFFSNYVHLFEHSVLQKEILPLLLVGLKDANNEMVAWNLRGLADLVPFLGADVVVGGERVKYFVEGRPKFSVARGDDKSTGLKTGRQMTAVSGVITIPKLMPSTPPQPLPVFKTESSDEAIKKDEVELRKMEKEKRRQEMRLKNEKRRKEREEKQRKVEQSKPSLLQLSKMYEERLAISGEEGAEKKDGSQSHHTEGAADEDRTGGAAVGGAGELGWDGWEEEEESEVFEVIEENKRTDLSMPKHLAAVDTWSASWDNQTSDWTVSKERREVSFKEKNSDSIKNSKASSSSSALKTSHSEPKLPSRDGFGGLFEIPEIKLNTSVSSELDYFADMEPTFKSSKSSGGNTVFTGNRTEKTPGGSPRKSDVTFTLSSTGNASSQNRISQQTRNNFEYTTEKLNESAWGDEEDFNLDLEDV